MADFNALEALINAYIKQNGVKAITGQVLNGVLRGMVSALGKGWTVAGEAEPNTDPGTMTGPVAYVAHTAGTYTNFGGLVVNDGEVAFLKYNEQIWTKEVLASLAATATVDDNVGTPSVVTQFVNGVLTFAFHNIKGDPGINGTDGQDGAAAGFGTVAATVDNTVGTPAVSVTESGPNTAKNFSFAFTGLKGETGVTSVVVTVDNTSGTPQCTASLNAGVLTLAFTGLKGAQGNPGSSVDYPFTLVNNLTTNDPDQALTAAMGFQLESEITQLEQEMGGFSGKQYTSSDFENTLYDDNGTWMQSPTYTGYIIPVIGGEIFDLTAQSGKNAVYAFIKSVGTNGQSVQYATGAVRTVLTANTSAVITAPSDAKYLWLCHLYSNADRTPSVVASRNKFLSIDNELADLGGKVSARIGAFFTRGYINADNTNHRFVTTANIFYKENGTQYTIPSGKVINYPSSFGGSLTALVFDKANLTFIIRKIADLDKSDIIAAGFYPSASTSVGYFVLSSLPTQVDGKESTISENTADNKISAVKNNRLYPVFTRGYINCDNVNRKLVVSANITTYLDGSTYIIPANTEVAYTWDLSATLYKVVFDYDNLTLAVLKWNTNSIYPVLFQFYTTGSPTIVTSISNAVLPVKINGIGIDDELSNLADMVGEGRDKTYSGERVVINSNKFGRKQLSVPGTTGQSFASYGDYIVACNYDDGVSPSEITAKLMSLSGNSVLATFSLPYGSVHRPHCNTCCFGNEFGSADSIVPLLYVSQWDYGYERGVLVYDIKLSGGVYSAELVQTIIPDNIGVGYLGQGDIDWVVDTDNSMLYAFAYYLPGLSTIVEGNKEMICKFALPALSDGSLIELTEADILDNWEMGTFNYSQDKCYNSGKIYIVSGESSTYPDWTKIRVLDLARKEVVSEIPLAQFGGEPEGMDIVQGFLTYGYGGAYIYRLFF